MITIDYMGEGGVENWQKIDYVICERSLTYFTFIWTALIFISF